MKSMSSESSHVITVIKLLKLKSFMQQPLFKTTVVTNSELFFANFYFYKLMWLWLETLLVYDILVKINSHFRRFLGPVTGCLSQNLMNFRILKITRLRAIPIPMSVYSWYHVIPFLDLPKMANGKCHFLRL